MVQKPGYSKKGGHMHYWCRECKKFEVLVLRAEEDGRREVRHCKPNGSRCMCERSSSALAFSQVSSLRSGGEPPLVRLPFVAYFSSLARCTLCSCQVINVARALVGSGVKPLSAHKEAADLAAKVEVPQPTLTMIQNLSSNEKKRKRKVQGAMVRNATDVIAQVAEQAADTDASVQAAVASATTASAKSAQILIGKDTGMDGTGSEHCIFVFSSVELGSAMVRCAGYEGSLILILDGKHKLMNNKWILLVMSTPIRRYDSKTGTVATSCLPLGFALIKSESEGAVNSAVSALLSFGRRMARLIPGSNVRLIRASVVIADGAGGLHNGAGAAATTGDAPPPADCRDSAHVLRKATHATETGWKKLADKGNMPQIVRDVHELRQSTTKGMFDALLKLCVHHWSTTLHEPAYATYFRDTYGSGNWARFATGMLSLDSSSQALESFNLCIQGSFGVQRSIGDVIKTDIQGLIRLAGERFRAFEKQGCFLRGSLLQAGVFPSEVVDSARDLTEGKTEPKCARFCCIDQDGAEVTISSFLADPLTCSLLFNRSRESRESGFMQRYRIQLAFERGELPTSPLSGKKGQEPQAPCEIAKKIHSLNRVTFVVKNGITVAQCTCLDFGQRGLCPDSAAALELANLINLKALSESMLPVCRGRKAVPLPTAKQIFRGVGAAAADSVPPCAHFRAEPGLGAKAGAQRGATGKSGRCYIGVRVSKVFQEAGRQPAVFYGQVTRCRNSDGALLWNVRYDDSDQEELDEDGVMNAVALYAALAAANGNSPPVKKASTEQ